MLFWKNIIRISVFVWLFFMLPHEGTCQREHSEIVKSPEYYVYPWLNGVKLRKEPSTNSISKGMLDADDEVIYLEEKSEEEVTVSLGGFDVTGKWLYVITKENVKGWVHESAVILVPVAERRVPSNKSFSQYPNGKECYSIDPVGGIEIDRFELKIRNNKLEGEGLAYDKVNDLGWEYYFFGHIDDAGVMHIYMTIDLGGFKKGGEQQWVIENNKIKVIKGYGKIKDTYYYSPSSCP